MSHVWPLIISTHDIIPDRPPVSTHAPAVQPSCKQASAPIEGGNSNQIDIWTGKTTRASAQGSERSFPHKPRVNVQSRRCVEKDTGSTVDATVGATAPISAPPVMTPQLPPDTPAVCNIKKAHSDLDGNIMRMRITLWC